MVTGGNLDWITFDKVTNKFKIEPTEQEHKDYSLATIVIKFEAYDASDAARARFTATNFEFEIKFYSVVVEKCSASTLIAQSLPTALTVSFYGDNNPFLVPLVTDSGTAVLQAIAGHESDTCGDLLYTPSGGLDSWVK